MAEHEWSPPPRTGRPIMAEHEWWCTEGDECQCGDDWTCGASLSARCFNGEAGCRVHPARPAPACRYPDCECDSDHPCGDPL